MVTHLPVLKFDDNQISVGERAKFDNGVWSNEAGTALPPERRYLVLGTTRKLVRFHEEGPPDVIAKKPGERLPDPDELNEKIPKKEWLVGLDNKPRPPWAVWYITILLDDSDAQLFTHANCTFGAKIATLKLEDRIAWMCALRGVEALALVQLRDAPMKTSFGIKRRPEFELAGWRKFADGALRVADQGAPALKAIEAPSLKEELNDEVPTFSKTSTKK
jgi:hypothetical protein